MRVRHGEYEHSNVRVSYKFQAAKDDRRHLIVIFSGFRAFGTYDFGGSATNNLKGNLLWIEDKFQENYAYYLMQNGESFIEAAVHALIEETRISLALDRTQITVAGFSKGGSASLYYGLKYNYENIVSSVPQFKIGEYLEAYWPKVHKAMLGDVTDAGTEILNEAIPKLLISRSNRKVNIYLISSVDDAQHSTQVAPFLRYLRKYRNFNYILTDSPMVREHDKVTRYNVPLILSLFSMFSENISPKLGTVKNGLNAFASTSRQASLTQVVARNETTHNMDKLSIKSGRLFVDGYAFGRGYEAPGYDAVNTYINFTNEKSHHEFQMATIPNRDLSYSHFENQYCDYTYGAFTTFDRCGISLADLHDGIFKMSLTVNHAGTSSTVDASSTRIIDTWGVSGHSLVHVLSSENSSSLVKRPILASCPSDTHVELVDAWASDSTLHVEGYFVVPGVSVSTYATTSFYLVLTDQLNGKPLQIIDLAAGNRRNAGSKVGDVWTDYSKAYFATPKYRGVDLSGIPSGKYDCWITARYGDAVFSTKIPVKLSASMKFPNMELNRLPSVGVIGSCVSRDNFSSRVVPDWKDFFKLHGSQYQMAFLSLMAPPIEVDGHIFSDVESHTSTTTMRDFRKSYLQELKFSKPDVLVIDLRADARFGCISVGDSMVTNNEWKLHSTEFYRSIKENRKYSMGSDFDEYLSMFKDAALKFELFRQEFLPDTKIVLNSARAISTRIDQGRRVIMSRSTNERINKYWAALDGIFSDIVTVDSVFSMPFPIQGNSHHAWGPGPLHYEDKFYEEFRKWLLGSLFCSTLIQIDAPQPIGH